MTASPSISSLMPNTATVKNPRAYGYHVRIGSTWYRLVTLGQQVPLIQTAESQPTRVDTSANPEDFRPVSGLHYSLSDASGGEGQDFAHRPSSSPNRFWDSYNIDVSPTDPGQPSSFRLLTDIVPITPPEWDPLPTSGRVAVLGNQTDPNTPTPNAPTLFIADATSIRVSTDPLAPTPTFTSEEVGPVLDLVVHDGTVFVSVEGEGTFQRVGVNSWEKFSNLAPSRLWSVKGRLLGGDDGGLHEVREGDTSDLVRSIPSSPDYQFTSVVDGGEVVLAASHSSIHMFTVGEDLALVPDAEVRVAESEQVTTLAYSVKGVLLYGTREPNTSASGAIGRLYRASLSQRSVSQSVLIRQWGDATSVEDSSPATIHLTRESAYTGIHEPGGRGVHLWRYDLSTTGRVREHPLSSAGRVRSIASVGDRLVASVPTSPTPSVFREGTSTATSGYLISPLIDHHSAGEKSWGGLTLDIDPSPGQQVEVWYSSFPEAIHDRQHPSWRRAAQATSSSPSRERPIDIPPSRYLSLMVVLTRTSPSASPRPLFVNSITTRSSPRVMELLLSLPINISDHVNVAGRGRVIMPGVGRLVYRSLQGLEGTNQYVELLDPNERIRGTVEEVTTPVQALDSAGTPTLVCQVRIRGVRSVERLTTLTGPLSTYHLLGTYPLIGKADA